MTEREWNAATKVLQIQKRNIEKMKGDAEQKAYYRGLCDMFDIILNNGPNGDLKGNEEHLPGGERDD